MFFQQDLFADSWGAMAETLRVRSYRMYCDAIKLAAAPGLTLAEFRVEERRLRRDYADVLACAEASPHADLMEQVLYRGQARRARRRPAAKAHGLRGIPGLPPEQAPPVMCVTCRSMLGR